MECATTCAVVSSITCHPRVFAKPALWPALCGLVFAVVGLNPMSQAADATVTIHSDARHQTILGWSGMPWYPKVSEEVRDQVLDEAVGDLGLTRVQRTVPSGNRSEGRSWEWTNDDADPMHIHWRAFGTDTVDRSVRTWVLPFRERVEARGDLFGLAITQTFHNGGSTGRVLVWLLECPAEAASGKPLSRNDLESPILITL
jgi:hypothetical protein